MSGAVMTWRRLVACAVVVAGMALGTTCGARQNAEPLSDALRVYNDGLRWQRFHEAASRVPAERRDDFLDLRDQLHDDLRIHHYEVIRVRYGPEQMQARVHVKYVWYLNSRGVVNETHTVQTWQRRAPLWVFTGERHLRGPVMPGMDDSDVDSAAAGPARDGGAPEDARDAGSSPPGQP